jgi:phage terminase large subunit-like protein
VSQEARGRLLSDPDLFISHYFKHRIERLEDFHMRLIRSATEEARALILYPAAHGKTTLVSTLLPIWALCKNPNVRVGIIGKNDAEANNISLSIQAELASNVELQRDFGPFRPHGEDKPWAAGKMTVAKRTQIHKEPTLAFFGASSKHTLGHRTDWTICDDVVTEKNSNTPEQRQKLREWFNQSVRTMGVPNSRLTVVGTLFDPSDLYNDLMEMSNPETGLPIWYVQREDAIVDEDSKKPLWPAWWPWISLMELKAEMGTLDFNKRLRNIAVDKSRMVFKEEYVKGGWIGRTKYDGCIDRSHIIGQYDSTWRRISGFDPAVGATRSAKFCAHITLALGSCARHERCIWVVDLIRDQLSLPQQVDTILLQHQKYDLLRSVVEANSYQAGLLEALKRRMEDTGLAFNIEPHYTTRTNKPDPELGVQSMSPWFENGWVHIPWGDPASMRKMNQFVDELIQYPGRTTDTVMAFWFAWKQLQETGPKYKSSNYLRKPMAWGSRSSMNRRRVVQNPYYA